MLKIAKSVEYALLAIKYLSEESGDRCLSSKEISDTLNIPFELLSKILQKLVKHNFIVSQQGTKGGYVLNRRPDDISLADINYALGEKIQITNCMFEGAGLNDCQRIDNCCLRNPLSKIQLKIEDLFRTTKVAEII